MRKLLGLLFLFSSLCVCAQTHKVVVYGDHLLEFYEAKPNKELKKNPYTHVWVTRNDSFAANIEKLIAQKNTIPNPPREPLRLNSILLIEFDYNNKINELSIYGSSFSYNNKFYRLDSAVVDEIRNLFPEEAREQFTPLEFQKRYVNALAATANPIILVYEMSFFVEHYHWMLKPKKIVDNPEHRRAIVDASKIKKIKTCIRKSIVLPRSSNPDIRAVIIIRQQDYTDTLLVDNLGHLSAKGKKLKISCELASLLGLHTRECWTRNEYHKRLLPQKENK